MSLDNLRRFLDRRGIAMSHLSRALGRRDNFVRNGVADADFSLEAIRDIEIVLAASGHQVPRNAWITACSRDLRKPAHTLYRLDDNRAIVAPRMRGGQPGQGVSTLQVSAAQIMERTESMQPLTTAAAQHFGLTTNPFANSLRLREDIYWTKEYRQLLQLLLSTARNQGFLAILGEVGAGKTVIKQQFREECSESIRIVEPAFPDKRRITPNNLLDAILLSLGARVPATRERKARAVRDSLDALLKQNETAVLLLDEAHDFATETIRSLKRLHELQRGFAGLLGIILVGQLELEAKLRNPNIREVDQRCARFYLSGLNGKTGEYLQHRLTRTDPKLKLDRIFTDDGIKALEQLCRRKVENYGIRLLGPYPLTLNVIATQAMNLAAKLGESRVNRLVVDHTWGSLPEEAAR